MIGKRIFTQKIEENSDLVEHKIHDLIKSKLPIYTKISDHKPIYKYSGKSRELIFK
jgi:hypothetical protein